MKMLILGVDGFIGHHLTRRILKDTDWEVFGMDLGDDRVREHHGHPRFHFVEGDVGISREWIEYHIKKCDVVLPLVAIATPKAYVENPLAVFELDFEENLRIVRDCVKYKKRIIFPSTSEVYGMCEDEEFHEDTSPLVLGPIRKERWIYACAKQLLYRVIWAYGTRGDLNFTLVRPFNWIGPALDSIEEAKEGSSRVVTQFIADLHLKRDIHLVDGGRQRRSFTYVDDGIEALMKIIINPGNCCDGQIFNLGNPENDCSIKELAEILLQLFREHPKHQNDKEYSRIVEIPAERYYGESYQDILTRKPNIGRAKRLLGWEPKIGLHEALKRTLDAFLEAEEG
jgi:nucleoside-diphosphate-sugar epimerase